MVFPYYSNLTRKQRSIYLKSDRIDRIQLKNTRLIKLLVVRLEIVLGKGQRSVIEKISSQITAAVTEDLQVSPIRVKVFSARPSHNRGELHGLYEPSENKKRACISVWMRTAKHKRVVRFRSFLRTLLHEVCHHLDYEFLRLEESFHTEGFFKRESSLFNQLIDKRHK